MGKKSPSNAAIAGAHSLSPSKDTKLHNNALKTNIQNIQNIQ